jgi:uncharacterized peroxidase-related enzyme
MAEKLAFTRDFVTWRPWVETVDEVGPTEEQAALVQRVAPNPKNRLYYATLAHDVPALRERTKLFNEIMAGRGGSPRADRELAAVATSRINGCVFCASVHARAHANFTKDATLVDRLLNEGIDAEQPARERAVIDYSAKLTRDPAGVTAADLQPLRDAGYTDAEILDINNAAAVFAWANRLMQTIGETAPPEEVAG